MMMKSMVGGVAGGFFFVYLLTVALLLGFAYIVWILSAKESGGNKTIGQVLSIVIAVLVVIIVLYGGIYGGLTGQCGSRYKQMKPATVYPSSAK